MLKKTFKIHFYDDTLINQQLFAALKKKLSTFLTYDELNPTYVFIIGGDGTFLNFAKQYLNQEVYLIGINTGTLGFYCDLNTQCLDFNEKQWKDVLQSAHFFAPLILNANFYDSQNHWIHTCAALNDFVIQSPYTLKANMFLNEKNKFLEYAGSGFILCTPTGSTGINKSNNGPVFFNTLNAYCLSFIMPVNNSKYVNYTNPFLFDANQNFSFTLTNQVKMDLVHDGMIVSTEILKQTKRIQFEAKKARCQIFLTYDCLETIQRMQRFF